MSSVSVVIPVYRSENSIALLVDSLARELPAYAKQYEVILVEDGGGDNSWTVIENLAKKYPFVRGFKLMRNFGQHNALLCGIRAARHDCIVTMDDDLQHPTRHIKTLLAKLEEGYDVVYGSPINEKHSLFRNIASVTTKLVLQGTMGVETAAKVSSFRAFRASLCKAFAEYNGPLVNIDVLLTWATSNFVVLPIAHQPRTIGQSTYTFGKLLTHAFNLITGFSTLPLRLASALGLVMTAFGSVILVYIILSQLFAFRFEVPGFTFTVSMIAIFSRRANVRFGNHRRIPCADAPSHHGSPSLYRQGKDRRAGSQTRIRRRLMIADLPRPTNAIFLAENASSAALSQLARLTCAATNGLLAPAQLSRRESSPDHET